MIALVIADRCTACHACVRVCPANVFERDPARPPRIARQEDCQTCFICELHCTSDALYVGADCERPEAVDEAQVLAAGLVGEYRRWSGWDEFQGDPRYANEHWRMDDIFARARRMAAERPVAGT